MKVYKLIIFVAAIVGSFLIGRNTSKEVIKETITIKELLTVKLNFEQLPTIPKIYTYTVDLLFQVIR